MRSTTSYFNTALWRKTMQRFWPLWALYGLIWLFAIPLRLLNSYFDNLRWGAGASDVQTWMIQQARDLPRLLELGVVMAFLFGVLCAMAVFGYLYSSRSACMMHTLPMRRETLFTTQYLAGLGFLLLPNLVVALLTLAVELTVLSPEGWGAALPALGVWLLCQSALCLFFFSFAAFCAMFTGHILALPVFYGILNVLVVAIYSLVLELMNLYFYGFTWDFGAEDTLVMYCTPVYALVRACRSTSTYQWIAEDGAALDSPLVTHVWLESAPTVAAYAAAGLVFAVLALMVYRRRQIESAGDVVAVPLVRPLFRYGVSFCSGLCFGSFTTAFFGWTESPMLLTICVLVWAVAGCFVAEMLLKKSFRVLGAWKGSAGTAAVLAVLCIACFLDVFGVENRVPSPDKVTAITVNSSIDYPNDSGMQNLVVSDPEQIREITALHQAIVREKERKDESGDDYLYFNVTYQLADGGTLSRSYHSVPVFRQDVEREASVTWCAQRLLEDRKLVEESYGFDSFAQGRLVEAWVDGLYNQDTGNLETVYLEGGAQELWQAVRKDFDQGTIGIRYLFDDQRRKENTCRADLYFSWEFQREGRDGGRTGSRYMSITLTPQAANTLALLERLGVLEEPYQLQTNAQYYQNREARTTAEHYDYVGPARTERG